MLSLKATVSRTEPFNITPYFNTESLITVLWIESPTQFYTFPKLLSSRSCLHWLTRPLRCGKSLSKKKKNNQDWQCFYPQSLLLWNKKILALDVIILPQISPCCYSSTYLPRTWKYVCLFIPVFFSISWDQVNSQNSSSSSSALFHSKSLTRPLPDF